MSTISTLSPASTYGSLLQIASNGQGLLSTPSQIQDGLGNQTLMTIGTTLINFDRTIAEFQLDGVALTANAATLNNLSNVANAPYILYSPNSQLPTSLILQATNGLTLNPGGGFMVITTTGELSGIQALNSTGFVVRDSAGNYSNCQLVVDGTLNLTNATGVSGNPTLGVINDTNIQRVNNQLNGVFQSSRSQLNFIPGSNMGITVIDNSAANRTDITFSANFVNSLFFKASCYAASTANLTVTYNNGNSGVGATLTNNGALAAFSIDGTNPLLNSRILIKDQTAQLQNGIYSLTTVGSGTVSWVLTRTSDFNSPQTIQAGDFTNVLNGTVNSNTTWIEVNQINTVGTDPIAFTPFGFTGTVTSVSGTPGQIDVANPTTTPVISIDPAYIGQTSITTLGTISTGTWHGSVIPLAYGGTNANLTASNGGIFYSTASAGAILAGTATANQVLLSGSSTTPAWSTATYPATTVINQLLYSSSANVIAGLVTANNGVLITSSGGVPSISSTLPTAVQTNITEVGTVTVGTWNAAAVTVPYGGTGLSTLTTAYGVVCAGTTPTAALQNAGTGTTGQVLTSNGSSSLPTWQPASTVSFDLTINQTAHGFSAGNVIRCTGSDTFALAKADDASDAEAIGIVTNVIDANNFTFQYGGIVSGLTVTAGSVYFLDPSTAGAMTSTAPSTEGQISKPLLIAITSSTGYWMNQRGQVL